MTLTNGDTPTDTLSITDGTEPGEFVITTTEHLAINIIQPADYAGDYSIDTADLDDGPLNLIPPHIEGTAVDGATLAAVPGLWAFAKGDGTFVRRHEWRRGSSPIAGETGTTYTIDDNVDAGETLSVVETGVTASGVRSATSVGVVVPSAGGTDWTPGVLPGLTAWFDAADDSSLSMSSDGVKQWSDKSGNGHHATPQGTAPTLTELNGLQAINLSSGAPLQFSQPIGGNSPRTLFAAVGELGGNKRCLVSLGAGSPQSYAISGYNSSVLQLALRNGVDLDTTRPLSAAGVVGFLHDGSAAASGSTVSIDGTITAPFAESGDYVDSGTTTSLIGRRSLTSGTKAGGPIGEVVLCSVALSVNERQKLEGFLAHKWGFAELLPTSHPYKSSGPAA